MPHVRYLLVPGETVPNSDVPKSVSPFCKRTGLFAIICRRAETTVIEIQSWFVGLAVVWQRRTTPELTSGRLRSGDI